MSATFNFNTNHKDLIHDVSFDYYGRMIATCSSDQTIKIWKYNEYLSDWRCSQQINHNDHTHRAAIQMICWANPIFGSIFASCSTDKKINIFALQDSSQHFGNGSMYNFSKKKPSQQEEKKFTFKRVFIEFHDAKCIAFVPKNLGLKLSIVCNNGVIKILTARDITNLSQWTQEYSINISYNNFINKNKNSMHFPSQSPKIKKSKSYNMDLETQQYKRSHSECIKSYCIAWNKSTWELPSFVVGTNKNRIFIYKYFDKNLLNESKNNEEEKLELIKTKNIQRSITNLSVIKKNIGWHCVGKIEIGNKKEKNNNNVNVRSISWSRHLGKKYHLLGIGSSDGYVRIIRIERKNRIIKPGGNIGIESIKNENKLEWNIIFQSNIHKDSVWKVKWNITGNVLLSAADDAKIYLWKRHQMNVNHKYIPICISNPIIY